MSNLDGNEEIKINWQDMPAIEQSVIIATLKYCSFNDSELLYRIFNVANPFIIWTKDKCSFRVADESKELLTMVTNNYYK